MARSLGIPDEHNPGRKPRRTRLGARALQQLNCRDIKHVFRPMASPVRQADTRSSFFLVQWSYQNLLHGSYSHPSSNCTSAAMSAAAVPGIIVPSAMASPATALSETPAILLLRRVDAAFAAALRQRFGVLDFFASGEPLQVFLAAVPEPPRAAVVWGGGPVRVAAPFLDAVPSLRCVVSTAAGVDHIDLHECARRGVVVANSGNVYSVDVADHAVGMLIDVLRRVSAAERFVRRGLWLVQGDYPMGSKLGGKRVGIIGLGNIGSLIAKRLEAFGCVIYYNSRRPKDSVSYRYFPNVLDLASESDVLIVACALNKETRHIVTMDVLEALGKDGVIVNIGRGANIDEGELVRALQEGRIAGAALDVFENEPKVPAELMSMDNVVLSPHIAVITSESRADVRDHTIRNLEAFFSGKPLLTPVLP